VMDLIANEPYEPVRLTATASVQHQLGNAMESDAALNTLIEKYHQKSGNLIALVYAIRGEAGKAFEWLQKSVETEGPGALYETWYEPEFKILDDDPRWEELLSSAGLSKQQLAEIDFEFKLPE